ncbi:MAG: energy-coupling factor ABC transporter ATP-binding protein [Fusobacteriaceae bacterium]|jgi:cobalt/nickel transport system ATP-binding protein|nr:energy-coupling factor ABC transporter ATP-binding protein [Fusobacteriaceae bacterium]
MLTIEHLSVTYPDGTRAISDFNLTVSEGEIAGIIGNNGAGKTSLFLSLVGILPAEGEVVAAGLRLEKKNLEALRRKVGFVFQDPDDQLFMPDIYEDIAFGPRSAGLPEEEVREKVARILKELGIEHLAQRSPLKLSNGEKRMAAIATALVSDPEILLLDEPTAFLDPGARRRLLSFLKTLRHTILVASHDIPFVEELCGRVVALEKGKIIALGETETVLKSKKILEEFY